MTNESTPPQTVGSNLRLGQLPARWYCVNRLGVATLCVDESDAKANAANCDNMYPAYAPHRAVLLGDVSAEREQSASLCESIARRNWSRWHQEARPEDRGAAICAEELASAIRA